jgi:hypothetical protein
MGRALLLLIERDRATRVMVLVTYARRYALKTWTRDEPVVAKLRTLRDSEMPSLS